MKALSTLLAIALANAALAQCTFTPTIEPNPVIVCPIGGVYLYTQAYDSYQWFENGQPLTGVTGPGVEVDAASIGNTITVQCTLDGCTEMSAPVLVDGWVFLLPYVIHDGDAPYQTGFEGDSYYCEGDTALLILGLPYDTNVQWTDNGVPIPGANNDTLVVTTSGNYSASGAPSVCPGWIQDLGLTITMWFTPPLQPSIAEVGDQLCIYPAGTSSLQWYLNGAPIVADECFTPTINGTYTVTASYEGQCGPGTSEPYDFFLGITDQVASFELLARPNPANTECTIVSSLPLQGPWRLMDTAGRSVASGSFNGCTTCLVDLAKVDVGNYLLRTADRTVRVAVVR